MAAIQPDVAGQRRHQDSIDTDEKLETSTRGSTSHHNRNTNRNNLFGQGSIKNSNQILNYYLGTSTWGVVCLAVVVATLAIAFRAFGEGVGNRIYADSLDFPVRLFCQG